MSLNPLPPKVRSERRKTKQDASKTRRVEHTAGSVLTVRDQGARKHNAVLHRICFIPLQAHFKRSKTAEMRAVQGVTSTLTGVYIDVHEQSARSYNDEMRSIYVRFTSKALFCSVNNIILQRAGKRCKQRTVTCYANNQRLIIFGVLLRI